MKTKTNTKKDVTTKMLKNRKQMAFLTGKKFLNENTKKPENGEIIKITTKGDLNILSVLLWFDKVDKLTLSTFRVGKKHARIMSKNIMTKDVTFVVSDLSSNKKENSKANGKYDYFQALVDVCEKKEWNIITKKTHAKIYLIEECGNYYVIESSANLNDNPKYEFISISNDKELYLLYYDFLMGGL